MDKEIWKTPVKACDVGGEALIEGVMMRGNGKMAVAVRMADGSIDVEVSDYVPASKRSRWFRTPFVRGAVSFVESMVVGIRVLLRSAEKVEEAENAAAAKAAVAETAAEAGAAGTATGESAATEKDSDTKTEAERAAGAPSKDGAGSGEDKFDRFMRRLLGDNYFQYLLYTSVAFALVLGIGLFMLLPNFVTDLFHFDKSGARGSLLANLIEGAIRLALFFGYIWFVSRNKEIHRVFQYHGAEHKSIYTLEQGEALTVENARRHTTLHPRCGTAFLFVVMIISIIVFMFAGWHSRIMNLVIRLVLLPVIAGISYEVFKMAAKSPLKPLRALSLPGLMLQRITTQEPDDSMLEVALAALRAVVGEEAATAVPEAGIREAADNTLLAVSDGPADGAAACASGAGGS